MKQQKYISNWGNYPGMDACVYEPRFPAQIPDLVNDSSGIIARGNGRSYGDSSLNKEVISTLKLNHFLAFDRKNGILTCQAGVMLSEILELVVPEGFFLPVTPGTKFITVGGAIAADVHGKNHHGEGCFSKYLYSITLVTASGELITCTPEVNPGLFWQTTGGMGSTGIILEATFQLKKIESAYIRQESLKARNLDEILGLFEDSESWTYTMSWIDCLQKGKSMGRSILMRGEHARVEELPQKFQANPLILKEKKKLNIPFFFPSFVLNTFSIRAFNLLYYYKQLSMVKKNIISYEPFFYPLDGINNWNRMYGKKGFTQYQFVIPKAESRKGLTEILKTIGKSGQGSFLAVLKLCGPANTHAPHSFLREGYTLALDFPIRKGLPELLQKLDKMVMDFGGRLYLAKDAFMPAEMFEKTYPEFPQSDKFISSQLQRLQTSQHSPSPIPSKA